MRLSRFWLGPTGDRVDPALSLPTGTKTGDTTADGTVFVSTTSAHKDGGTLYTYASTSDFASVLDILASGTAQAVTADGPQAISVTGLTGATLYYLHYYYLDTVSEGSNVVVSGSFTTDASGPNGTATITTGPGPWTEAEVVTGFTSYVTIVGDTFISTIDDDNAVNQALRDGWLSDRAGAKEWNTWIVGGSAYTVVGRIGSTIASFDWIGGFTAGYDADGDETITVTIPSAATTSDTGDIVITLPVIINADVAGGFQAAWARNANTLIQVTL